MGTYFQIDSFDIDIDTIFTSKIATIMFSYLSFSNIEQYNKNNLRINRQIFNGF